MNSAAEKFDEAYRKFCDDSSRMKKASNAFHLIKNPSFDEKIAFEIIKAKYKMEYKEWEDAKTEYFQRSQEQDTARAMLFGIADPSGNLAAMMKTNPSMKSIKEEIERIRKEKFKNELLAEDSSMGRAARYALDIAEGRIKNPYAQEEPVNTDPAFAELEFDDDGNLKAYQGEKKE